MGKYKRDKVKLQKRAEALSTDIMGSYVANIKGWGITTLLQDALELAERRGYKQAQRDGVVEAAANVDRVILHV